MTPTPARLQTGDRERSQSGLTGWGFVMYGQESGSLRAKQRPTSRIVEGSMSEVSDLHAALVAIPSVNPSGRPVEAPEEGEERITEFVHDWFAARGIECVTQEVMPGRENVIARVRGRNEPPIVFEAHMDTVSVEGMTVAPFEPREQDGRVSGRGSCDAKGCLAAMMVALARVDRDGPPARSVVLCAAVDEEYLHGGARRFLEDSGPIAAAVIGEPTKLRVVIAHKGALRVRVTTLGVSAHSSNPERGVNSIYRMARAVLALEDHAAILAARAPHPLVGSPTLSVGTIRGGVAVNVVPEHCEIMVDRRIVPGETPDEALAEIEAVLAPVLAAGDLVEPTLKDCAVETAATDGVVELALGAAEPVTQVREPEGVAYCTDGCDFAERGIPLVVLGPGDIAQAHTADEWIELAQLERAVDVYERVMRG